MKILEEVHKRFYDEYDARPPDKKGTTHRTSKRSESVRYDVRVSRTVKFPSTLY